MFRIPYTSQWGAAAAAVFRARAAGLRQASHRREDLADAELMGWAKQVRAGPALIPATWCVAVWVHHHQHPRLQGCGAANIRLAIRGPDQARVDGWHQCRD